VEVQLGALKKLWVWMRRSGEVDLPDDFEVMVVQHRGVSTALLVLHCDGQGALAIQAALGGCTAWGCDNERFAHARQVARFYAG
jgi:hypothetical protein